MTWMYEVLRADLLVPFLADWAVRGTVVLGAVAAVAVVVRHQSAATRHAVWVSGIVGVLSLPLVSSVLPDWRVIPVPEGTTVSGGTPGVPTLEMPVVSADPEPTVGRFEPIPVAPAADVPVPSSLLPPLGLRVAETGGAPGVPDAGSAPSAPFVSPPALLVLWMVGVAIVFGRLGVSLLRMLRIESRSTELDHEGWRHATERVAARFGVGRRIRLLASGESLTPMTWGVLTPVIMLPDTASSWSATRRRDVLLHEIAHIRRADFVIQLVARIACGLLWFHPFVWVAAHRLRVEREQACDDAVLAAGARPSDYAGHLVDIARAMKAAHAAEFAAVAMARPSQLATRVRAVLATDRSRATPSLGATLGIWALAALVLVPVAAATERASSVETEDRAVVEVEVGTVLRPEPVAPPFPDPSPEPSVRTVSQVMTWASAPRCREGVRGGGRHGTSENVNNDRRQLNFWDDACEGSVTIRGEVRFTPEFDGIVGLERDGRFEIEIDDGTQTRAVELRDRNGSMQRRWVVDGDQHDYGADAEAWLSAALTDFFRHSAYQLDQRVTRLLGQGVDALLAEAGFAHGGYLKRRYYAAAMESGQLDAAGVAGVLQRAVREVSSDFEMGRLLQAIPPPAMQNREVRSIYLRAAGTMESDFEQGRVLTAMLQQDQLSDDLVLTLLRTATQIESDFELGRLLMATGDRYLANATLQGAYLDAAAAIESDFELQRVLATLLAQDDLTPATVLKLLETSAAIDSDFETGRMLTALAGRYALDGPLQAAFFRRLASLDSDFEHQRVLNALVSQPNPPTGLLRAVLQSASNLDSDHELSRLLQSVARRHGVHGSHRGAFFQAFGGLGSDHERQNVLVAVIERNDLDAPSVDAAVAALSQVDSDHALGQLILTYARRFRSDDRVRNALLEIADGITSDYEHRRAMEALGGRRRTSPER